MERGRKHDWVMTNVGGEVMPRCSVCGLLGSTKVSATSRSIGWRGEPTYGCTPSPSTKAETHE